MCFVVVCGLVCSLIISHTFSFNCTLQEVGFRCLCVCHGLDCCAVGCMLVMLCFWVFSCGNLSFVYHLLQAFINLFITVWWLLDYHVCVHLFGILLWHGSCFVIVMDTSAVMKSLFSEWYLLFFSFHFFYSGFVLPHVTSGWVVLLCLEGVMDALCTASVA